MTIITVKTGGIAADAVTDAKIADDVVGTEHLTANEVDTAALKGDAVTGAELADNAVNSEHYTDGSIDTAHIAADQIVASLIADNAISDEHLDPTAITGQTAETSAADGDLILISDDSASAALRKMTRSNFLSGVGESNTPSFYAYGTAATSIANDTVTRIAVRGEQFDNGGCYNATASNATLNSLTSSPSSFTPNVAGLYFFTGAIMLNTASFNVGIINNKGGVGGSETYSALVYSPADTANRMVMVSGFSVMNGSGNQVCLSGYQASGGSINTNDAIYTTYFGGFLVKAS